MEEVMQLRQWWLQNAVLFLADYMARRSVYVGAVRVSESWLLREGLEMRQDVNVQCILPRLHSDGASEVFISPQIVESIEVLELLLHQLIHIAVGILYEHSKKFAQVARHVGLEVTPTSIISGSALRSVFQQYIEKVGSCPHM